MPLAQELLTNIQCSDSSRSFAKEMRALKMRSIAASPQKLTTANWEPLPKLILLQLHKLPKNSTSTILPSLSIWSKLKRWKSLISECLMSWLKVKKLSFWSVVFSYFKPQQETVSRSDCDVWWEKKSGLYTITRDYQLSGWTKKKLQSTSQSRTCTKKRSWSSFGQDLFWCKCGFGKCFRASFWSNH